jgi:hypothetical protein
MHGCSISSQECLLLATDDKFKLVEKLDLSSNPIGFEGLYYLIHGKDEVKSVLKGNLKDLELYNCEITLD